MTSPDNDTARAATDGGETGADGAPTYLFSATIVRPPLDEFDDTYRKRIRGMESSGTPRQIERLTRAWELARDKLAARLGLGESDESVASDGAASEETGDVPPHGGDAASADADDRDAQDDGAEREEPESRDPDSGQKDGDA